MGSAVLQVPRSRSGGERRRVLRAAIRQLERAEIYMDAVVYMEIDDREAHRAVARLLTDLQSLRRYLADLQSSIRT